jgi:integrase
MPKSRPQPPRPDRRRSIRGSFSWIDHRFLREGFDEGLTRLEKLLYFVLVAVSNQDGVSFYSDARLADLLDIRFPHELDGARRELLARDLIAYERGIYQVLDLPACSPRKPRESSPPSPKFWQSFRTYRDLVLVGLMLLDGLRSCEVLALELEDVQLADGQIRIHGKGNKKRLLPLHPDILEVLGHYLRLERPLINAPALFVCLKGRRRGQPMTAAGLRSLFRHHRVRSQVRHANPHRLRHSFGADMVRAGISLPALQRLMGHSQISTTLLYVELAPQDVWCEYARAIEKRMTLDSSHLS